MTTCCQDVSRRGAVHRRSLAKLSNADRQAARIPLENTGARILLLGATRDHVWPSGDMTRDIAATLRAAGKGEQLTARVFQDASHFICGTGEELQRIAPVVNPEGGNPSPEATARAAAQAWAETNASWPDSGLRDCATIMGSSSRC